MPVIGHAFVGLATAIASAPREGIARRSFLWVPVVVALSYLPDIIGQALGFAGADDWRNVGHSLLLALPIAAVLTPPLVMLFRLTWARGFLVALISVSLHSGLDAMYGGKLMLLWPLTAQREGPSFLHDRPVPLEMVIFPAAFGVFYIAWRWRERTIGRDRRPAMWLGRTRPQRWVALGSTFLILVAAAGTYGLGLLRHHQSRMIDEMCSKKRYAEALRYVDLSARWPSSRSPARSHCSRGMICWSMGDRARAEAEFLAALDADPQDFWVVYRLAEFNASLPGSLESRRQKAEPFIRRLQAEFARHPDFAGRWPRLARKLEYPQQPAQTSAPG